MTVKSFSMVLFIVFSTSFAELKINTDPQILSSSENYSVNSDWYNKVIQNINKDEYNFSFNNDLNSYQVINRKNNLLFTYSNYGFEVKPPFNSQLESKNKTPNWKAKLKIFGYGRENIIEKSFNGKKIIAEGNAAYIEDENIKMEYINNKDGMRQNFIIKTRPKSKNGP